MKISYNWLKDYLNIDMPKEKVSVLLTEIGLEVSKIEKYESIKGGLSGLVIGEVLSCTKHPNADKLSVTTVNIGENILPIVCGAPNVATGQKVVVATVGTTLYTDDDSFQIKKSKIRGEISEGMICAEDEIGLGSGHDGIMVLDEVAQVGTEAKNYFDIYTDIIFEIDLTPNRQDAISHFGVARDLYAYLKINSDLDIELKLPNISDFKSDNNSLTVDINLEANKACHRYSGLTISGIQPGESPQWLQNRLLSIGNKPVNNVVDITNYVLHEIGQPLHAFDMRQIPDNKIIVGHVADKTKFVCLDELELELDKDDLMICNSVRTPLCIGGVFGGLDSGVKSDTTDIFLESAFFNPVYVRKSAKRHTLSTDASYRFERGVDPNNCLWGLKRAAMLIKEICGGQISSEIKDIYPEKIDNFKVELHFAQLNKILGFELAKHKIIDILKALEIKVLSDDNIKLTLEVPTYRFEVRREADVIEEIIRIYGYNNIEITDKLDTSIFFQEENISEKKKKSISHYLTGNGFFEIMSFSLLNSETYRKLEKFDQESPIKMQNPLSKELNTMRQSLVFGALDAVQKNINNQNADLKFFEFGHVYYKTKSDTFEQKYQYSEQLLVTITGKNEKLNWKTSNKEADFYTVKSLIDNLLSILKLDSIKINISELTDDNILKYGLKYKFGKDIIAKFGSINRQLLKNYNINQEVYFADINWNTIMSINTEPTQFTEIIKFPKVKRDLAILIDKNVKYSEIEKIAYQVDKKLIKEVGIFDLYEGDKIPDNKKSYAINIWLQSTEKTLTDKQIKKTMDKLIYQYKNKLNAEIR